MFAAAVVGELTFMRFSSLSGTANDHVTTRVIRMLRLRWLLSPSSVSVAARFKHKTACPIQNIVINEFDLKEEFTRSASGPGGQAVNKTASRVRLKHIPSGIVITCQDSRSLPENRAIARKRLREQLDVMAHGGDSKLGRREAKDKKRDAKKSSRSKAKYETLAETRPAKETTLDAQMMFHLQQDDKKNDK